ncbi:UNVERIFIED_CONTAM: hypothetical protein FKN15_054434 [Acipenser sinensis]
MEAGRETPLSSTPEGVETLPSLVPRVASKGEEGVPIPRGRDGSRVLIPFAHSLVSVQDVVDLQYRQGQYQGRRCGPEPSGSSGLKCPLPACCAWIAYCSSRETVSGYGLGGQEPVCREYSAMGWKADEEGRRVGLQMLQRAQLSWLMKPPL